MEVIVKQCGCDFCNDLRNIEPAKYVGGGDEKLKALINKAKEKKQFIGHYPMADGVRFEVIDKCPICGYEFTEEDYDSYL
jgi:hypothetical protein